MRISHRTPSPTSFPSDPELTSVILQAVADAVIVLNHHWQIIYLNPAASTLLRRPVQELVGMNIWKEFPEAMQSRFYEICRTAMRSSESQQYEVNYAPTESKLMVRTHPFSEGLIVCLSDITEHWLSYEATQRSEELYRFITENSADLISLCDAQGTYLYVSPVVEIMLGYSPNELLNRSALDLVHTDDQPHLQTLFSNQAGTNPIPVLIYRCQRKDGTFIWLETTSRIYRFDKSGSVKEIVTVSRDITERKQAEDAMFQIAFHDPLTGLPNRKLLNDRLAMSLRHARRHSEYLGVLFLDLDRFKTINDTMGHQMGDLVLQETAHRLRACLREEDTIARFGGDEFVVILPDILGSPDAIEVAKNVIKSITPPYRINDQELHINTSIGIALYPDDGTNAETLLKNADNALYQAKESGRNKYKLYTPAMHLQTSSRMFLESGLRRTLEREELRCYYQPIWSYTSQTMESAEILLRWKHPVKGILLPSEFIPLAEELGLIESIGSWIMGELAQQIRTWQKQGITSPVLSVNVSPHQFMSDTFLDMLTGTFAEAGVNPALVQLELTEQVAMENLAENMIKLGQLKDAGFLLAIDDFGSGYSSLNYLRKLPFDTLKIDQSFTKEVMTSKSGEAVVNAIVSLGHTLQMKICIEGIETQEQFAFFQAIGCDRAQGFYIAKPQKTKGFTDFLTGTAPLLFQN